MTLPSSGPISVSAVNSERGAPATQLTTLSFLDSLIKPGQRPAQPNLGSFYGKAWYLNNIEGNCNNGNCTSNCNCGNINCRNCVIAGTINCANCDTQSYYQTNCNCNCSYNCNTSTVSYNCNCACNCSKIVCAKLYEFGLMSPDIWSADQAYGKYLRKKDKSVYRGYIKWARIVTMWMEGRGPTFLPWLEEPKRSLAQQQAMVAMAIKIATPWSEHMAYLMGTLKTDNFMGKVLMNIGQPLCRIASWFPKSKTRRHTLVTT